MPATNLCGGQVASCCWWRSTLNINTQPIGWFDASRCSPKFWFSLFSKSFAFWTLKAKTNNGEHVFFRTLHYTLVMMIDHDGNGNWDYNCGSFDFWTWRKKGQNFRARQPPPFPPFGPCLKENTFWAMGWCFRRGHIFICDAVSGRVPGTD